VIPADMGRQESGGDNGGTENERRNEAAAAKLRARAAGSLLENLLFARWSTGAGGPDYESSLAC
jgi:hypothetical protein